MLLHFDNHQTRLILLFARIFGRYVCKSGSISNDFNMIALKENSNYKMYKYSSEHIMHYDDSINVKEFNKMYNIELPTKQELINTVDTLNLLEQMFPDFGKKI